MSDINNRIPDDPKVVIDARTYQALLQQDTQLRILASTLLETAGLNYRKDGLCYNDELVSAALRGIYPAEYRRRLDELQNKEA